MTRPERVSREDVEAAVTALYDWSYAGEQLLAGHCRSLVLVLVRSGWGPKLTVTGAKLDDIADGYAIPSYPPPDDCTEVIRLGHLPEVLRECGVEVTD